MDQCCVGMCWLRVIPYGTASVTDDKELVNGALRRLLDETSDLIDSPTFTQVLTRLLDASTSKECVKIQPIIDERIDRY